MGGGWGQCPPPKQNLLPYTVRGRGWFRHNTLSFLEIFIFPPLIRVRMCIWLALGPTFVFRKLFDFLIERTENESLLRSRLHSPFIWFSPTEYRSSYDGEKTCEYRDRCEFVIIRREKNIWWHRWRSDQIDAWLMNVRGETSTSNPYFIESFS